MWIGLTFGSVKSAVAHSCRQMQSNKCDSPLAGLMSEQPNARFVTVQYDHAAHLAEYVEPASSVKARVWS